MDDLANEMNAFFGEFGQKSLSIECFVTSPKYRGLGRAMLNKIVPISNDRGYNGRVTLSACTGSIPSKYTAICGDEKMQDVSCAIKYKKLGFMAIRQDMKDKIEQAIANNETGLQYREELGSYVDTLSCIMELTDEARRKYLGLDTIV